MQSNNPVFARQDGFNGRGGAPTLSNDPSQWQIDLNGTGTPGAAPATTDRMTLDSVVEKTAISLGVVTVSAALTWFLIGDLNAGTVAEQNAAWGRLITFNIIGIVASLGLALLNSFKKVVNPALILLYAAAEGLFVGAISKYVAVAFVGDPSIIFQAVLGTFVAFAATLGAYKFFNIQVTPKFQKVVIIATAGAFGVMLVNLVLSLTGVLDQGGLRGFNTLGLVVSLVLVVLAVFNLVMDFDYVERGIEAGLPRSESWRAAFGLTVTLVWLYIEILRIIAILRGND